MEDYKYRENPLEFHSNFDEDDILNAEQVLLDNEIDNPKSVLDKVCKLLFNVSPYNTIEDGNKNILTRKNYEEFGVTFNKQDVIDAENCLKKELGENADEAQVVLQAVCYALVDLELYDEEYDDNGEII